jgi:hypothetical protein
MSAYNRHTHTSIFIAAVFAIAKLWNQPSCPSTDDWIKETHDIHIMEYYSATKKNEIMSFAGNVWNWRLLC